ncbi:MAG: PQQ-binding-like beta-propeller repeat protein [Pseudonocardiaceae bacterium]
MTRFPRGVINGGRLAVVRDRGGTLIALDIATGAVLWRHGQDLRPCAIHADTVVAVRLAESPTLRAVVLAAEDGRQRWTSPTITLPVWARPALDNKPGFTLHCQLAGDQITINWTARARYEGGASPSRQILDEHAREASGAVRLDLATLSMEMLPTPPSIAPAAPAQHTSLASPRLAADVLDSTEAGTLRVELAAEDRGGADAVVLRAIDRCTAKAVWEIVLDEPISRRAPRLRP